jgi:hypothetical protein
MILAVKVRSALRRFSISLFFSLAVCCPAMADVVSVGDQFGGNDVQLNLDNGILEMSMDGVPFSTSYGMYRLSCIDADTCKGWIPNWRADWILLRYLDLRGRRKF